MYAIRSYYAAGDIGVAVKLKDTHTGNTLTVKGNEIEIKKIVYPRPVRESRRERCAEE